MKKTLICFIVGLLMAQNGAMAAVTIKKAASVSKKETSVQDVGGSLVPTAISLYSTIQQLNQKQQQLSAECEPTNQEVNWVNDMIKEWAKSGGTVVNNQSMGGMVPCAGGETYADSIKQNVSFQGTICYDTYNTSADNNMIWKDYPKASMTTYYIVDGEYANTGNAKNKKVASNIYDIFNLIDFGVADYSADEAAMASRLMEKMEKCAPAKLQAKKMAMWGEFAMGAVGSIGQKTNTGSVAEAVSGIVTSGSGLGGALQGLGGIAIQLLDK